MNMKQTTLILLSRHGGRCILGILIAGALLVCSGCKSDSDPKCDCPNGTVHLVGDNTCCNYDDCVCEKDVVGERVYGIPVTNREGLSDTDFSDMCKTVEDGLDAIKSSENGQHAYMLPIIKKHIAEIRILPGPFIGTQPVVTTNNNGNYMIMILKGTDADTIGNAFYDFVIANPQLK